MKMGNIIKELRVEHNMTQSQLAKQLNISQDTVSLWERGKSQPDVENLKKLMKIFGVSADFLLGETDY